MAELEFEPEVIIPPQGLPKHTRILALQGFYGHSGTLQNAPLGNPAFLFVLGSLRPRQQSFADLGSGLVCSHMDGSQEAEPLRTRLGCGANGDRFGGQRQGTWGILTLTGFPLAREV